ncbi:MASE1 domain-containing protein [Myxococcus sp. K15C18031901]|uniref:MASE1 domain-containing protein n=1 Tax=Myxococcus dinghuensis TaxID=2906761 RepID=UPI0020A77C57|nr:MASE1 domain-containing protein [Myxococcus dinghuensis]MCP3104101.1 MASE1 domain-containing protein [Myxococcus dinghuensis]
MGPRHGPTKWKDVPTFELYRRSWQPLARLVLFTCAYLLGTRLGTTLAFAPEGVSSMWPPSGIALAALLLTRHREWPGIVIVAILVEPFGVVGSGATVTPGAFVISAGNMLEALAGAGLLRWWVRFRPSLDRVRDVLGLVGLAAAASPLLSATVGMGMSLLEGRIDAASFWPGFRVFWVGDAMGVLLVAPLLLTWLSRGQAPWSPRRRWELVALLLLLGIATHAVFRMPPAAEPPATFHPATYLSFPFLLWAALRFEARGISMATALMATLSLWHTARGNGPFAQLAWSHDSLTFLQSFLAGASVSGLLLAGALGERRRAQEEVSHLNQELRQSLQQLAATQAALVRRERMAALGELSATVAHEVRNPLGAISNALAALRRLAPQVAEGPANTLLGIMDEEVQRLDLIVNDLLDFTRPVEPRLHAQPLGPVVEGALTASLRSGSSGITVSHAFDEPLPPISVDAHLLHVALTNLFTNAVQAMPSGGQLVTRLEPDTRAGTPHARLTISDTGHGITPEVQQRIFEPFFTTRASGTGLGLAIVRRIVDGHHGEVAVHSTVGQGTTFTVWLPYAQESAPRASA